MVLVLISKSGNFDIIFGFNLLFNISKYSGDFISYKYFSLYIDGGTPHKRK